MSIYESLDHEQNYEAVQYKEQIKQEVIECSVLVIGAGGSGMVAAIRAAECGQGDVVILEKGARIGGNAMMAVGMFALETEDQKAEGKYLSIEKLFRETMKIHQWKTNPKVVKRYFENSATFMKWINEKGLVFTRRNKMFGHLYETIGGRMQPYKAKDPSHGPGFVGSAVVDCMRSQLDKYGNVKLFTKTKATKLMVDIKGNVVGAKAVGENTSYIINAKSVIIAAGGLGANKKLLERFFPQYFYKEGDICRLSLGHSTGDGIMMAEEIGAEIGQNMGILIGGPVHHPWNYGVHVALCCPENIYVNKLGERFMSESAGMDGAARLTHQPDARCFSIMDEDIKNFLYDKEERGEIHMGNSEQIAFFDEQFEKELKENKEKVYKANTIEEAAELIGCPVETLKITIENYNQYCIQGKDDEFYKEPEFLHPIRKAPYYIIRGHRFFDTTHGGITINERLQALDKNKHPIKNLYVCGDNASEWCGQEYWPPAGSLTWAFNSGYMAGEEAMKNAE